MLINCPECNKKISDAAMACPNCGFPIENIKIHTPSYDVVFKKFNSPWDQKVWSDVLISNIRKINGEAVTDEVEESILTNNEVVIWSGLSVDNALMLVEKLKSMHCIVEAEVSNDSVNMDENDKIEKYYKEKNTIKCPRCGSTAIITGQRGFSLITGFLGSNKTVNRCGKCGYSWNP